MKRPAQAIEDNPRCGCKPFIFFMLHNPKNS